jgi:hypothetical protein
MFATWRRHRPGACGRILPVLAFFLLTAIPAMADDVPNSAAQVLAASPYQVPGALPEGVGVLGRARPGYEALGVPVGDFYLYPTLAASLSSDDNVLRTSSAPVSDLFWTLSPRIALRSQWSQDSLRLYAQLDDYRYDQRDSENRTNWIAGGTGNFAVAPGTTLDAETYYFHTHESRTSPDLSSQALSPTAYAQFHSSASILNQPGPLGLSAGVNYDRYVYDPTTLVGGGLLDNADRNSDVTEGFVKALYEFQPEESVYARLSYNVREFDLHLDRNGFDHSSDGYRLDTGLQMLFTPLIKGTMFLGYLQQNFKRPFHSVSGVDFGSQIDWFATELVTVHFATDRQLTDTIIAGASSEDRRSVRASFDYELLRNVILQGNIGYENDVFDGISRNDRIVTAGFGAKYLLNRHMSLYADYTRGDRSSNARGENFTDNLLTFGIRFQY